MRLEHVTKTYGETVALKDLSLDFEEGKITAVLGESGAGKTTLLNILAGLLPAEGEVDGVLLSPAKRRGRCSYLFQDAKLLPHLTAEGNLKFVLPKSEWGKIGAMLERVGLGSRGDARPFELSGGERQRVAIARAFLYPHDLLLMDEPFSSLDLHLKRSLIELVLALRKDCGSTVIFVTHDVREAALLAERALVLKKGEIVLDLPIGAPYPRAFLDPPRETRKLEETLLG